MIYFNNAATTYPKPEVVVRAVADELQSPPVNPYRDHVTTRSPDMVCRENVARLFGFTEPGRIILCSGATEALNLAIFGLVKPSGHVVTTCLEHNAVLRPLYYLCKNKDVSLDIIPLGKEGTLNPEDVVPYIRKDTNLVVINHASNVTGFVCDIKNIYEICSKRDIPLVIDASQSAGSVDIDMTQLPQALIAFTGHKSLLGPEGTGGLLVGGEWELMFHKVGGIGIRSESEEMPDLWPLKYEAGTMNHPGFAGLAQAVLYVLEKKIEKLGEWKEELARHLTGGLKKIPGITIHSVQNGGNRCGIVSFSLENWDTSEVGFILQESYGIRVRTGLHCAPLIHKSLGTYPDGAVRVSFSSQNTHDEVDVLLEALYTLKKAQ